MRSFLLVVQLLATFLLGAVAQMPTNKVYGVNLGSWLLLEPWMLPKEWQAMGGQICTDCSQCIMSEFAFSKAYPDSVVDEKFAQHWDTWFTQNDVAQLKAAGINTIRIPLGYWIVEGLVNRPQEEYPRGGLKYLIRGLSWLRDAGMNVILDHHALPGVQVANQMFAGRCTSDVEFYTQHNFHRALVWTAIMTTLSHLHPNFESVFSIQAVNEPTMNAGLTPNYGEFQKNFVKTVRAVETILGIEDNGSPANLLASAPSLSANFVAALKGACSSTIFNKEVTEALSEAVSILLDIAEECDLKDMLTLSSFDCQGRTPLVTNFMDINWQYNNPSNPADAAMGPQAYDNHLYYSFGGVADPNPIAYMQSICNLSRVQNDAALGNTPLWFGEWSLATNFNATDAFLKDWADAQKLAYSESAGWIFWNFKLEPATQETREWSYLFGLEQGYLTQDPSQYHDPNVCARYAKLAAETTTTTTSATTTATGVTITTATGVTTTAIGATTTSKSTSTASSTPPTHKHGSRSPPSKLMRHRSHGAFY